MYLIKHDTFWTGTLKEYISLIEKGYIDPAQTEVRIYEALKQGLKNSELKKEIIGMEHTINKLIEAYFHPASRGYDIGKRMLILIGPPGSGKSSFVRFLKRSLEQYSYTKEGAVFRIKDCPLNENPLLALPNDKRKQLYDHTGIKIKGSLSPLNQFKLKEHYGGDWQQIRVERFFINEAERKGIGTFFPSDPYTQDLSDLVGSVDYSKVTTYGSPSDPRAYRYDGEFQAANQGILELHEVFKSDKRLLYPFLTLAEEKTYKISRQSMVYADEMIIGHSNEEDLKQFINENDNRALLNRMVIIRFPYNLTLSDEVQIYQSKLLKEDVNRMNGFALETLGAASILSRLKRSNDYGITLLEKMDIYNGIKDDVNRCDLINEHHDEGMEGLDPRIAFQVLAVVSSKKQGIIGAYDLLHELSNMINSNFQFTISEREKYNYVIDLAKKYYLNRVKTFVIEACSNLFYFEIKQNASKYAKQLNEKPPFVTEINHLLGIDDHNEAHFYRMIESFMNDHELKKTCYQQLPITFKRAIELTTIKEEIKKKKNNKTLNKWVEETLMDELEKYGLKLEKIDTKMILVILNDTLIK